MAVEFIPGIVEGGVHTAGASLLLDHNRKTDRNNDLDTAGSTTLLLQISLSLLLFAPPHRELMYLLFSHSSQSSAYAEGPTRSRHCR